MVLNESRRPSNGRVALERARVVVVHVQVVLARPSGQRIETAVYGVDVVQRLWWAPEEVHLLSLSGDLRRRHRDRDQG